MRERLHSEDNLFFKYLLYLRARKLKATEVLGFFRNNEKKKGMRLYNSVMFICVDGKHKNVSDVRNLLKRFIDSFRMRYTFNFTKRA